MLYIVITWDTGIPLVRHYEDRGEAVEIYKLGRAFRQHVYLYETDESGHMELILEEGRL